MPSRNMELGNRSKVAGSVPTLRIGIVQPFGRKFVVYALRLRHLFQFAWSCCMLSLPNRIIQLCDRRELCAILHSLSSRDVRSQRSRDVERFVRPLQ